MPGYFTTSPFWYQRNSWNTNSARAVLASTTTTNANDSGRGSAYQQDLYFDDTSADGSGNYQDLETLVRDAAGRVTTLSTRHDEGAPVTSTYTYRPDGRVGRLVNPDGTHDFTYDSRGLMATQVVSGDGTYTYGYDVMGHPSSLTYPDGHTRTQVYDDLGRITSRCYGYSGPTTRCYTASYDAVGNPVTMSDPDGTDTFVYDALDRLTKVTRVANGVTTVEDYAYNALGALKLNAGVALNDQRPRLDGNGSADAAVPASVGGLPVTLDAGGRVTSLRGTAFTYTKDGTLREADDPVPAAPETYGVDARGRRYSRMLSGSVQEYYVYEGLDRVATLGPNGSGVLGPTLESYLFDGIDHPLRIKIAATSTTAYYEIDLAGNVRGLRASDRGRSEQKHAGSLRGAPAARRAKSQDREPLVRWIPRALLGGNASEPCVLDAQLLAEERNLLLKSVDAPAEADAREAAVGTPAARARERDVRDRRELHDRGARELRPPARQILSTIHPAMVARNYRVRRASPDRLRRRAATGVHFHDYAAAKGTGEERTTPP